MPAKHHFNACKQQGGKPPSSRQISLQPKGTAASSATRNVCPCDFMQENGVFFFPQAEGTGFSRMRWAAALQGRRESPRLRAGSNERTKTDPPKKGQHMSPRPQKCHQPPSTASAWHARPNLAQPCQVPRGSHLLLWATTSAKTRTSLVLRLHWTWRDLSPCHAVLFPRGSEVFAAGAVAGSDFYLFPCWAGYWDIHPSTRHKLDLPKAHMSETGRTVQPTHHGNCYDLPPGQ